MAAPGEAKDDWQVLTMVAAELGVTMTYADAGAVRIVGGAGNREMVRSTTGKARERSWSSVIKKPAL